MDISFSCNKCGQQIAIDEAGAGQLVDCPKCGIPIEVPCKSQPMGKAVVPPPLPSVPAAQSATKKCPYCAEEIRHDAIKCKHCGEFLNRTAATDGQPASSPKPTWSPGVAAVLSLVIPGAGQMYRGRLGEGFAGLSATLLLYGIGISRMQEEAVEEQRRLSEPFLGNDVATVVWHYGWILILVGVFVHVVCVVKACRDK
jgi:DNA-directed RNA polymerase subunit RPC12/RpoP